MKKINLIITLMIGMPISAALAQGTVSKEKVNQIVKASEANYLAMFKDIHANPELPFTETRTAAIVAKELKSYGYEVKTGIGKTGVVGIMKNGEGPVVMYRADMDCNAVVETTGLPYASTKTVKNADGIVVPVMHACGHDAHTVWMLGIASAMAQLKSSWSGTLIFVGQPAEEIGEGANAMAKEMYKMGVPVPTYLLGMHTAPLPVGIYLNRSGDRMAGADQLDVIFKGVSGHGSQPQETKDPVVMAANAILQYQTLISRNTDPQRAAVLTVGAMQAGIDNNVIPEQAILKLNLRWFSDRDRNILVDGIERINKGIAVANGLPKELQPEIIYKQNVTPLKNNKELVDKINVSLEAFSGPGKNLEFPPVMGSEDFHHLVIDHPEVKYDYILVGIANQKVFEEASKQGKMFPFTNHNGDFMVDLTAIPYYTAFGTTAVLKAFEK